MKVEKIPIIIRPILAFIAGLFFYTPILPVEIILKNGDIFIADFVSENESSTTIKWKNDVYVIPKAEIRTIDLKKAGSNKSYRPIEYILLDGSRMKGIFVEQDKDIITLKSELGFLKIDKTKISKIEGEVIEDFPPPRQFTDKNVKKTYSNIGIYGTVNKISGNSLSDNHPYAYGGGFYIEPSFVQWTTKFRAGITFEYLQTNYKNNPNFLDSYNQLLFLQSVSDGSNLNYLTFLKSGQASKPTLDFVNIIPYLQYRINSSPLLDFYFNVGIGTSYLRLVERQTSISGFIPAGYFALGWQGLSFNKVIIRIGGKLTLIREANSNLLLEGVDMSVGYML